MANSSYWRWKETNPVPKKKPTIFEQTGFYNERFHDEHWADNITQK